MNLKTLNQLSSAIGGASVGAAAVAALTVAGGVVAPGIGAILGGLVGAIAGNLLAARESVSQDEKRTRERGAGA
jgi:hypothetical protein